VILACAAAWFARDSVMRPIRLFGALALSGIVAVPIAFMGFGVPRALLATTACLALAFSVNDRRTRRPTRPGLTRGAWIAAAAVMLAALPNAAAPQGSAGIGALSVGFLDIELIAALAAIVFTLWAAVRIVRGILADRGDRLLVGALLGLVAFVVLWTSDIWWARAEWTFAFWLLLGTAVARASGNLRRP